MCNIAHFLLPFIWLVFTYFVDFYCLSIMLFVNCTVLYVDPGYLNFLEGMNEVSTFLLTYLPICDCQLCSFKGVASKWFQGTVDGSFQRNNNILNFQLPNPMCYNYRLSKQLCKSILWETPEYTDHPDQILISFRPKRHCAIQKAYH